MFSVVLAPINSLINPLLYDNKVAQLLDRGRECVRGKVAAVLRRGSERGRKKETTGVQEKETRGVEEEIRQTIDDTEL